jgi:hypothetical protein
LSLLFSPLSSGQLSRPLHFLFYNYGFLYSGGIYTALDDLFDVASISAFGRSL